MTIFCEVSKKRKIDLISVGEEDAVLLLDSRPFAAPLSPPTKKPRLESVLDSARSGDYDALLRLVTAGSDVNEQRAGGCSALHFAAFYGHKKAVELLVEKGAALDARNLAGYTPLAWAVERGHTDVVHLLLERGATISERDNRSFTALHAACVSGHTEIARLIVSLGRPDLDLTTDDGQTPLALAVAEGHVDVVRVLLKAGADPNKSSCQTTPLVRAVCKNHAGLVEALLESSALDVNQKDSQSGRTALHWAAFYDADAAGRRLLSDRRTNIEEQDKAGATAATIAAQRGSLLVLAMLQDASPATALEQGPSDEALLALLAEEVGL